MRAFDEYISRAPGELGAFCAWQIAPPLPFIPEDRHGDTLCVLVACWTGAPSEAEEALAPLRGAAGLVPPPDRPRPSPRPDRALAAHGPPPPPPHSKALAAEHRSRAAL